MPALVVRDLATWLAERGGSLLAGRTPPGLDRAVEGVARPRRIITREIEAIDVHEAVVVAIDAFPPGTDYPLDALITFLADTQAALIVAGLPSRASAPDSLPYDTADRLALPLLALPLQTDLAELARETNDFLRARQVQAARAVRETLTVVSRARHAADPLNALATALANATGLIFVLEDAHRQLVRHILPAQAPPCDEEQALAALASYAARQAVRPATAGGEGEDIPIQRHLPGKLARAIIPVRAGTATIAYLSLLGPETRLAAPTVDLLWRVAPAFAFEMGKLREQAQAATNPPLAPAGVSPPVHTAPAAPLVGMRLTDLTVMRLLDPLRASGVLDAFSRAALAPLLNAATPPDETLITTLDTWFAAHDNLTEAARRLTIHRNTLMYRLHRIQELLGASLDDADARLSLLLALKIWRMGK